MSSKKSGTSEQRSILSFEKLAVLLKNKEYTLATVYCNVDGDIYFVEARTPKIQKTFVISIPSKYKMKTNSNTDHYKSVVVTKLPGSVENRQLDYITEVKGPLLDCDLLSISSSAMCLCKNNGNTEVYKFGNVANLSDEEEDDIENLTERDPVEKIIHTAKKIDKKLAGDEKLVIEGEESSKEDEEQQDGEYQEAEIPEGEEHPEVSPPGGETPAEEEIELEFQDENGKPFEESQEKDVPGDTEPILEVAVQNETLKKEMEEVAAQKPKDTRRRDNSVPESIEDADISLGIIYYVVEIGLFNKKVSAKTANTLENEIINVYDTIDDNEGDIRNAKLDEVTEMAAKLACKAKEEVEKCKREELGLKTQILKLSSVLDHCEKLKAKMAVKPEKYTDVKPEVERLYKQTKSTLYEMNVEILRNKDRTDETLAKYQTSLEELLGE